MSRYIREVRRGDIYYADLSPVVGSEQGGIRPVLILQNNVGNLHSPTVIACAITARPDKTPLPTHVAIGRHGRLSKASVALLEQIRTIAQGDAGTTPARQEAPRMTDFKPYVGHKRKPGTGCVSEINDHLFEGRYSPMWPDGKKHARNVYAKTREECEEKLKVLIVEMKKEIAEAQRLKDLGEGNGQPPEGKMDRRAKKGK